MTVTYFTGETAFVTGGSAGMGAATVRAFAEAGANVAIVDLDGDPAQKLADDLAAKCLKALAVQCDVTDDDPVAAATVAWTGGTFERGQVCRQTGAGASRYPEVL
ncbi:short chain dehydrogenase [Brevibacterium sandarakinum]|uniref:Short chain dehydrogenase n=1 Tax=Brevibacterium sandarakinum TaxID=629680 RepID=A0A1H1X4Q7_BRESA|nr:MULTISPECIES: SDR family NAD(P)-dependent oxidoreductase [Micrococcales]SDT04051.1 short chain dehydrogenase [Brevibacterium sandarakinum]